MLGSRIGVFYSMWKRCHCSLYWIHWSWQTCMVVFEKFLDLSERWRTWCPQLSLSSVGVKEQPLLAGFLWAASLINLHFADPKPGEFIWNLSSGFDWLNQANREHLLGPLAQGKSFHPEKPTVMWVSRWKIWTPSARTRKGRSFSASCFWEICHWPKGEMGTVGTVSCCCYLIICRNPLPWV